MGVLSSVIVVVFFVVNFLNFFFIISFIVRTGIFNTKKICDIYLNGLLSKVKDSMFQRKAIAGYSGT